jgi:hypothetical protein
MPDLALSGLRPVLDLRQQLGLDPDTFMRDPLRERPASSGRAASGVFRSAAEAFAELDVGAGDDLFELGLAATKKPLARSRAKSA